MKCGRNSVVECQLPKLDVVGSNPIARFRLTTSPVPNLAVLGHLLGHFRGRPLHGHNSAALLGPCIPLRFLVRPECRTVSRQQMEGFSDSAIFHRWMDLFWTFREP